MRGEEMRRICVLERQIAKINQDIASIGDLRRGSLSEQYAGHLGARARQLHRRSMVPITS